MIPPGCVWLLRLWFLVLCLVAQVLVLQALVHQVVDPLVLGSSSLSLRDQSHLEAQSDPWDIPSSVYVTSSMFFPTQQHFCSAFLDIIPSHAHLVLPSVSNQNWRPRLSSLLQSPLCFPLTLSHTDTHRHTQLRRV